MRCISPSQAVAISSGRWEKTESNYEVEAGIPEGQRREGQGELLRLICAVLSYPIKHCR
jgi:hypothetical protein